MASNPVAPAAVKTEFGRMAATTRTTARNRFIRRWTLPILCIVCALILVGARLRADERLLRLPLRAQFGSVRRNSTSGNSSSGAQAARDDAAASTDDGTHTVRVGCREYAKGGQSCVYSGVACVDVNTERAEKVVRPKLFIVDDSRIDGELVSSDRWCQQRHRSADPRYFGPREWPLRTDLFAPRWSCLNAVFRRSEALFNGLHKSRVRWLDDFSLIDLDYVNNDHNNHYVKDIVWLLDVALWQATISASSTSSTAGGVPVLFPPPKHILLPQSRADFIKQTRRDVNRLNFAIINQLNPELLYGGAGLSDAQAPPTQPLLEAYPELTNKLVFYGDERANTSVDLVCTRRLVVGSKLGDMGHERVCQHLRTRAWRLFGISEPPRAVSGFLQFPQPPKRVVLLQRHLTRKLHNVENVSDALRAAAESYGFEFELRTTKELKTAEDHVRFFSRIGVLLTPHGSQAMGGMWMPRHAALIEVFPPGYTDYAFNLLSGACNLWYYELQGLIPPGMEEVYRVKCGKKMNSFFDQCVQVKNANVVADVDEVVKTVVLALKRLGHAMIPKA